MKRVYAILTLTLILLSSNLMGHDLSVTLSGHKIYFNITNEKERCLEVTYCGSIADGQPSWYVGELQIPARIRHNNSIYKVTSIGAKAFSGANELTGITIPNGVKSIGDFAFEGCSALSKIIFPANSLSFGQGVFFKCDKIAEVNLGSEWQEVDFEMFKWSNCLTKVTIPSSVGRIRNMKSLRSLSSIEVEADNEKFSSIDGVLYNKAHDILYGCPRAYQGTLKIAEGTTTITPEALSDCFQLSQIDFPESLNRMSFRELRRSENLSRIIFRSPTPVLTATNSGQELFLLEIANPSVEIVVPKSAKKEYKKLMPTDGGEYCEIDKAVPFQVEVCKMATLDNMVWAKNFDNY